MVNMGATGLSDVGGMAWWNCGGDMVLGPALVSTYVAASVASATQRPSSHILRNC